MTWISNGTLAHLSNVADWPDMSDTPYELIEKIGQGGMGTVFLAQDRKLERRVAIKVLNAAGQDAQSKARMVREARIIAGLEHPSIVPVHDCGELPDGRFFYAMKLIRGKRLDEVLVPSMPLADRLQLFQKICDGVAFAHAQGVIHRDLKPQNIMLGAFGELLVMDWGIAKETGQTGPATGDGTTSQDRKMSASTTVGTVLGTPGYMAPEQAASNPALPIDERADVYSLGAILYFLLTGQAPSCESPSSAQSSAAITRPRSYDRTIPRPLEAICMKSLAADRAGRYRSVAELAEDIGAFMARKRVAAYPEGLFGTALRLGTTYRTVLALLLAYLLMRILLLIFANG
jgi:eukaryotic-like serine/threonine-protein kinase